MPTRLSLRLFGTFEARVHGSPLRHLRTRRGEWLLALLALRAGQEVERGWLAGTLWPQSREAQALSNLRESLCDLRRAAGDAAGCLLSPTSRTLALDLTLADVDVVAFDTALARGDLPSLEQAVALYRGPLLEECVEEWVFQERQAREQACLSALEALAAAAAGAGDRAGAERLLRRATGMEPLRESAQRALMQVLAAGGNYAAALQVYRELRLLLHREINAEPDAETTALFQQLRADARAKADVRRQAPDASKDKVDPRPRPLTSPELAPGIWRLAPGTRHNLPAPATPLIGREREVRATRDRLLEEKIRLLTLTGPGGTGKTRLALQVGTELLDEFADGVFFISLAPIRDPELVPSAIAQVLGVREADGRSLLQGLKQYLREKHLLLLLDNFEQVLEAAPVVSELLAAAPRLKVLVTSRAILHLNGEHDVSVPPLALPPVAPSSSSMASPIWSSALRQYAAVELFIERAVAAKSDFTVTNENAPAVAEICARLDGLPLAIELAAARIKLFSPQALLSRLERRLPLLVGGARDLPARQQTLRGAIAWSYDLLTEGEKRLFRRLSVFLGGCTLEAAEAVCGGAVGCQPSAVGEDRVDSRWQTADSPDTLDRLASLMDKSLLRQEERGTGEPGGGEPRFVMLETIREYGLECLEGSGEADAIRRQHAAFFLALAERAEPELWSDASWLERLEAEHDNLHTALDWCAGTGVRDSQRGRSGATGAGPRGAQNGSGVSLGKARHRGWFSLTPQAIGLRLAGALWWFWQIRGHWTEARQRLETALAGARGHSSAGCAEPSPRWKALCAAGYIAADQGDIEQAVALGEESLALCRQADDRAGMAWSLRVLAEAASNAEEWMRMAALDEESLGLFRELEDQRGTALGLHTLGWALGHQVHSERVGNEPAWALFRRAVALEEESVALCRQEGYRWLSAAPLDHLGRMAVNEVRLERAKALLEESLAIHREFGNRAASSESLRVLASVAKDSGDEVRAIPLLEESLVASRECGDKRQTCITLLSLGGHTLARGEFERAGASFDEALALSRELGIKERTAMSLLSLASLAHAQGNHERARALLEDVREVGQGTHICMDEGHLLLEMGDYAAAHSRYEEGLALRRAQESTGLIAPALLEVGHAAGLQGEAVVTRSHAVEALELFQARQDREGILAALESLAVAALAQGQKEHAARLLGAVAALREALGPPGAPWWRRPKERIREAVCAASLEQEYAAAWANGRAMLLQQAIDYALTAESS